MSIQCNSEEEFMSIMLQILTDHPLPECMPITDLSNERLSSERLLWLRSTIV
jgi:hypothetical protein